MLPQGYRKTAARIVMTVTKVKRGLIADWKSAGKGGNPALENTFAVLNALGVRLSVKVP
jgi:DNA-binding phage protein